MSTPPRIYLVTRDGLYLARNGRWVEHVENAKVFDEVTAERQALTSGGRRIMYARLAAVDSDANVLDE